MLKGVDLSHHNSDSVFNQVLETSDFIIHKLTEGKTYIDPKVYERINKAREMHKLTGVYHYARPENNNPNEEAVHFANSIPACTDDTMLYILDWEGTSLHYNIAWALEWCRLVKEYTGRQPLIYASANIVKRYGNRYGLWWTAHYNKDCENGCEHDGGVNECITQFSNTPYDIDIFHGTKDDWSRIGFDRLYSEPKLLFSWLCENKRYTIYEEIL